jgi:UDP-N-acetyl-2-amino-2-deoxyglucuronate dehydrogenase
LIGAAGFIAPRHMEAIKATGNRLVAAMDPSDSVGILDSYFPDCAFFTEFERFDRHIDKLQRGGGEDRIDYVSVCSPNYLHDAHIRFGLRSGADVICEKPLVLNPWNLGGLGEAQERSGHVVNTILQLRLHPTIIALRDRVAAQSDDGHKHEVELTYVTGRGLWYNYSWKGDDRKAGGIATNIGIHFFDMLHFVFGELQQSRVHLNEPSRAAGYLEYERARVRWFLSVSIDDLPGAQRNSGQRIFRSITIDGQEMEFSGGFADLHTRSYAEVLAGNGFGVDESRAAIETVAAIRSAPVALGGDAHPFVRTLGSAR